MNFSPVMPSAKSSRTNSPTKQDLLDSDADLLDDGIGDDSMCSNFSDFTVGQYGAASQGLDKILDENPNSPKKSPVKKSRPQTPVNQNRTAQSTATTPRTARPLSRGKNLPPDGSPLSSPRTPAGGNQTTNLMDFTTQFEAISRPNFQQASHRRTKSASPTKGSPSKTALPPSTPTESRFFNLLDFSPGPVATPRSIPSITPREVEELKSGFNSQISQMKAQLSGREVEVSGLRTAVEESEERCGELAHDLKEQQIKFQDERNGWLKVKVELGELFEAEKTEKESISTILMEKERVVDNLHVELETKTTEITNLKKRLRDTEDDLERTREEVIRLRQDSEATAAATPVASTSPNTQAEVERVARELHALYKTKHETKVAALKKSYESRWEKKVTALQDEIKSLNKRLGELTKELEEKQAEELTADMSFSAPSADEDVKRKVSELQKELEDERAEKAVIVNLVEELLSIQNSAPPDQVEEKMRGSVRRASGVHGIRGASGLRSGIEKMGMGARRDAHGN
ncbi:central kinetochore-associated-domain-containing protein [Geopyxis carbonaria]|nr:central kinetochore-associated-domain-containing protein [Geopyxis carbonaria]